MIMAITDEELMDIAREHAADGGRWPSDWLEAMRKAMQLEREKAMEAILKGCPDDGGIAEMVLRRAWDRVRTM